jgi:AcrR family transcriptional regulator
VTGRPDRREQIVTVARDLLENDGPEALTMRNLASAMGIKAPSLYKHVKNRHEIETLLSERALAEIGQELAAAATASRSGGLESVGAAYRAWAKANPELYRLATSIPLDRDAIAEGVEQSAEAPLLDALDSDRDRARACWALAHGLVILELSDRFPPGADIDAAWRSGISAMISR